MHDIFEWLFDWLLLGFGVPILIGAGFTLLADEFKEFKAARVCFYIAAVWVWGKVLMWAWLSEAGFPTKAIVGFIVFGVVGVALIGTLHLTRKRELGHAELPKTTVTKETHSQPEQKTASPQHQKNSGGTNVQQQSFGNGSPNISQVGPCNIAQVGHNNIATVNCAPPSGTELARFGAGTVVQIVNDASGAASPVATGFWLNDKGYVATCLHSLNGLTNPGAFVPMPPLFGEMMTASSGGMITMVTLIAEDKEADIAILQVINSPFQRQMHAFASAQRLDEKGGPVGEPEVTQEQYWVPVLAPDLPKNGDDIIGVGFVHDSLPVVSYNFGRVKRVGTDYATKKTPLRLYTSLPFKESDCGAPIINNAKTVIGMIRGTDESSNGVAIPVSYVLGLLKSSGH
jgi:hypothetical protein